MSFRKLFLLALLPSLALAQAKPPPTVSVQSPVSGDGSPGSPLGVLGASAPLATTAPLTLYVDPTGSDSNACTASGVNACLTIQGALNKIPQGISYPVKIFPATGTYAGADLSGFLGKVAADKTLGSYLQIEGTYPNATVATGTATGTASAGSAGSGITFGTLTDGTQTWTVNDLRGKYIKRTGGTGSGDRQLIDGNTATVITIVGTWSAPDATTTYRIEDLGVTINTATDLEVRQATTAIVADTLAKSTNGGALIYVSGGVQGHLFGPLSLGVPAPPDVVIRGIKFGNSGGLSLAANGPVNVGCIWCQFQSVTSGAGTHVQLTGGASATVAYSWFNNSGASATRMVEVGDPPITQLEIQNSLTTGTSGRFQRAQGVWQWDSVHMLHNGFVLMTGNYRWGVGLINNSIFAPATTAGNIFLLSGQASREHLIMNTCSVTENSASSGIIDADPSDVYVELNGVAMSNTGANGFGVVVGIGARMRISATSSITGTANEIELDASIFTLAQMRAASPKAITNDPYGTMVFQ